tara:strand:+ start:1506 stop:1781 length:276 start_codon:yes stop_codon:yes gene_type:complete
MAKLVTVDQDTGAILIENKNGAFGVVSSSVITDKDGLLLEGDTLTVLENNGFELDQCWDTESTCLYLDLNSHNRKIVFNGPFAELVDDGAK